MSYSILPRVRLASLFFTLFNFFYCLIKVSMKLCWWWIICRYCFYRTLPNDDNRSSIGNWVGKFSDQFSIVVDRFFYFGRFIRFKTGFGKINARFGLLLVYSSLNFFYFYHFHSLVNFRWINWYFRWNSIDIFTFVYNIKCFVNEICSLVILSDMIKLTIWFWKCLE